jgi:WD40 repeat protein
MNTFHAAFVVFILFLPALAQTPSPSPSPTPPATDIYLVSATTAPGQIKLGQPARISDWRGYNNQPFFLPDGKSLLYTSIRADKQADIYNYDLAKRSTTRVTETPESEYSPTLTPDGRFISVVRVEGDGTQRLWKFPIAGGAPVLLLEKIKPVGYHAWIDENTLALFILGQPNTLQIVDVPTGKAEVITQNIGRTLRRIPKQDKLSFVSKVSDQDWLIKSVDLKTRQITTLIKTLPRSEDYAWTPSGVLLMTNETKLFKFDPLKDSDWQELIDFSQAGLKTITRIAVSARGDTIAIVAH